MKIHHITNSRLAKLLNANITLYPFIFYIGGLNQEDTLHEMTHVRQIEKIGVLKFYLSYLLYYFAGRLGGLDHNTAYMKIPYEQEAYNRIST